MSHYHVLECTICGKSFKAVRSDPKTCSSACRQKFYRKNEKLKIKRDKMTIKALEHKIIILGLDSEGGKPG